MVNFKEEYLIKLFQMADLTLSDNITDEDISKVLIKIENKLMPSQYRSEISSNGPKVLIVDDLELSIHQLSLLLSKSGYNVVIARSENEAIQEISKQTFQFILLDLFLPDPQSGFKVLETTKRSENNADTSVIVMSGTDDKELINQCFVKGAFEFIKKSPTWHKDLLKVLLQLKPQEIQESENIKVIIEDEEKNIVTIFASNFNDEKTLQEMQRKLISLVNTGYKNIILDMNMLSPISTEAIKVLVAGFKTCAEKGGVLTLINASNHIEEKLAYMFLQNVIKTFKTKEEALECIKAGIQ